jgi:hypothetical protein
MYATNLDINVSELRPLSKRSYNTSEPPRKRGSLDSTEGHSRKRFLNELRAICDRWLCHIDVERLDVQTGGGVIDGDILCVLLSCI